MQSMWVPWRRRKAGLQTGRSQAQGPGWNSVIPTSSGTLAQENEAA